MKVEFDVKQNCNGDLIITGKSLYIDNEIYRNFLFKDCVTVNIITLEDTDNPQLVAITYSTHESYLDEIIVPIHKDGLYNITLLIVPSLDWYLNQCKLLYNSLSKYNDIIISDGKNLYKIVDSNYKILDDLLFLTNLDISKTTINKGLKLVFLTCFLWKCYISLAKQVLTDLIKNNGGKNKTFKCGNESEELKDIIYRRDFVWATINVLKYLTDACKFELAQKILNKIISCNGFCFSDTTLDYQQSSSLEMLMHERGDCNCKY